MKLNVVTANIVGIQGDNKMYKFLNTVKRSMNANETDIWLCQSHNLVPGRNREIEIWCGNQVDFEITFGKKTLKQDGTTHYPGGTLTLVNSRKITLKHNKTKKLKTFATKDITHNEKIDYHLCSRNET